LFDENLGVEDIKIVDFGISLEMNTSKSAIIEDQCVGSLAYMAPETLEGRYNNKGDVWACGILAFVVLGGYTPFLGTDEEVFEQLSEGGAKVEFESEPWESVSTQAQDFIRYLLNPDQKERPTVEEALSHPWLLEQRRKSIEAFRRERSGAARNSLQNLKAFRAKTQIKQAVYSFISSQIMSKEDKEHIDHVFRALDVQNNGYLNRQDVQDGFNEYFDIELTSAELDEIFTQVSGTGRIEYSDFVIATAMKQNVEKTLHTAFRLLDKDHDGYVNRADLKRTLNFESDESCMDMSSMMNDADADGDGLLTYSDLVNVMMLVSQDTSSAQSAFTASSHPSLLTNSSHPSPESQSRLSEATVSTQSLHLLDLQIRSLLDLDDSSLRSHE